MSLLTVCQAAARLLNQPSVSAVVTAAARTPQEFLTIALQCGEELLRRHDWGGLVRTAEFTALPATVPGDFERLTQGSPVRLGRVPIRGALSDAEMNLKRSAPVTSPPRFQLLGPVLDVAPAPAGPVTLEYVSSFWIKSADTMPVYRATFLADSDRSLIPEEVLLQGLVWRWKRLKGLAYQDELDQFEQAVGYHARADRALRLPAEQAAASANRARVTV
ncbi:hypothetical protein BN1110_02381 [bacterium YEK0313]|nr:hypothetical protein BN1110_02381 [bacterium YEK0313]